MSSMFSVEFLILFPLLPALLLSITSVQKLREAIVRVSAVAIAAVSVYLAYIGIGQQPQFYTLEYPVIDKLVFGAEVLIALFLLYKCRGIKVRELYIPVLIVLQGAMVVYLELGGEVPHAPRALYLDNFSIIMALIIGIIGSLICVYSLSYMKDYHHHHGEMKDRRKSFFFVLFMFLSAMFGLVFANNLMWLFLCWEVTTLSSFLLIAYPKTEEATRNAYLALGLNMVGGVGFGLALFYIIKISPTPTLELDTLIAMGSSLALLPAILISFAGLTKSAQMPFSSWLLGAMVAPTPVSALLHSSTMVKAGIFIIIKFAPVLHNTVAGQVLALVGGVTFLMTSLLAVTQSNAKRVLAYSTIANLGLIVACAGLGTYEALWAAILLTIFHAVSKGQLFLAVGSIEHQIDSRDIEDEDGLIVTRPALAVVMFIGILGMFLAPFGMLISKWAALQAFVDASPLLAILLAFGSAPTLFFWTKWMGKIISVPMGSVRAKSTVSGDEWSALGILAVLTLSACALFPLVGTTTINPYLVNIYGKTVALSQGNLLIMAIMFGLFLVIPFSLSFYPKPQRVASYLGGANIEDTPRFMGSMGMVQSVSLRNYYMSTFYTEGGLTLASVITTVILIIAMFAAVGLK